VPRVHTPHGLHLYYAAPPNGCFTTVDVGGKRRRGLGPGIDFKCDLSQCHAPGGSSSSPYRWDDEFNLLTIPSLTLPPARLIPVEIPDEEDETTPANERRQPIGHPGAYAEVALDKACERIRGTAPGTQRFTLNAEAYAMGRLAAGLNLDRRAVVDALIEAGMGMQQQAGRPPWRRHEVRKTVLDGFRDGLNKPKTPVLRSSRRGDDRRDWRHHPRRTPIGNDYRSR